MVDGNGTETGHIIVTTIGGRNGQSKQVNILQPAVSMLYSNDLHLPRLLRFRRISF